MPVNFFFCGEGVLDRVFGCVANRERFATQELIGDGWVNCSAGVFNEVDMERGLWASG